MSESCQPQTQVSYYGPVYIRDNCLILPVKTSQGVDGMDGKKQTTPVQMEEVNHEQPEDEQAALSPVVKETATQVSTSHLEVVVEMEPQIPVPKQRHRKKRAPQHPESSPKPNGVPDSHCSNSPRSFFQNIRSRIGKGKAKGDPVVCEFSLEQNENDNGEQLIQQKDTHHEASEIKEKEEVERVLERLDNAIGHKSSPKVSFKQNQENTREEEVKEVHIPTEAKVHRDTNEHSVSDTPKCKEPSCSGARPKEKSTKSKDFPMRSLLQKNAHHPNLSKPSSHLKYPTESKATMQKAVVRRSQDRHRRHSSDGLDLRKREDQDSRSSRLSGLGGLLGRRSRYVAVVAIDFGTTFSGYAYSFSDDPSTIHMMRKLEGGDPGVFNQKTPTTILLTPEGHFHSFGYAARDFFHDLEPREARKWMYFDRFKMLLHGNPSLSKETTMTANNGSEVSSLKMFSYGLAFFKDHALRELSDQSGLRLTCDDIRWVITVPAIWNASAKQFMRQAAYDAGLVTPESPEQLLIALEPEAASIYCRKLRMYELVADDTIENSDDTPTLTMTHTARSPSQTELRVTNSVVASDIAVGTRYMVVDCGGGTVDITVHQMDTGGKLRELFRASGGPHGSLGVDMDFERLLKNVFGWDCIEQFQQKLPAGWVDLMISFESKKRTASPYRASPITVSFPFSFIHFYKKYKGNSLESAVKKSGDKELSWTPHGMFKMEPGVMRRLFLPTVNQIKQAIGDVLNSPEVKDLSYMFLVGGFAESSILQHEIRQDFGHLLKVIIPQGVGMTIVKGAVLFGLDPLIVNERRSRLTYGVGVLHRFNPDKHPVEKKVMKDGIAWCTDILDKFVTVDQPVALGDVVERSYTPVRRDQTSTVINIYSTSQAEVVYITDPGVSKCGALSLELLDEAGEPVTGSRPRREIKTSMRFGDTEIKVTAMDVKSGNTVQADVDFFNT